MRNNRQMRRMKVKVINGLPFDTGVHMPYTAEKLEIPKQKLETASSQKLKPRTNNK